MAANNHSLFSALNELPVDVVLGTAVAYRNDPSPHKVNLGIGAYRTEEGQPWIFDVVKKVEKQLAEDPKVFKEYLRESGLDSLVECTQELAFGSSNKRICSVQSLSGTGALHLAATFIKQRGIPNSNKVYVSSPTWPNHFGIFQLAAFEIVEYPYWDNAIKSCNVPKMVEAIRCAPEMSIIVLHPCAHNPTGEDPTEDDWKQILKACVERKHIPILDSPYQGFASGDVITDRHAITLFYESGIEFFVAQSFAKNMGLYGERIGMLHVVCKDSSRADVVITHLRRLARQMYSNPPLHGALIVDRLLNDKENYKQWLAELRYVSNRLQKIRVKLRDGLVAKGTPGSWNHITKQIGMFSFTGLTPTQCERMISTWHVYMLKNGRISLAGLNDSNVQQVIDAIDDCVRNCL